MLTQLQIQDFALVHALDITLAPGFTVITGETGAGKSILFDALHLCLGHRGKPGFIRQGASKAKLTAVFDITFNAKAKTCLTHYELWDPSQTDNECIIHRVISQDGRSKAYINGTLVPLQILKSLAETLVEIHGQHANQVLVNRDKQLAMFDATGDYNHSLTAVSNAHHTWKKAKANLNALTVETPDKAGLDLLAHEIKEIENLQLSPGEWEKLNETQRVLSHSEACLDAYEAALNAISEGDDSAQHQVHQAIKSLESITTVAPDAKGIIALLNESIIALDESVTSLQHALNDCDANPEKVQEVEARLSQIFQLARKHHIAPEKLLDQLTHLKAQLENCTNREIKLAAAKEALNAAQHQYEKQAALLSKARKKMIPTFEKNITTIIQTLGMEKGRFMVQMNPIADGQLHEKGMDDIVFYFQPHKDLTPKPLAQIASGGELARVSLALQVQTISEKGMPTCVFDEVDTGIGGGIAEHVGQKMRALGKQCQVLSVTHLPQVAIYGNDHLRVMKTEAKNTTQTKISRLTSKERIDEIARMVGGLTITAQTRRHAKEMMEQALPL